MAAPSQQFAFDNRLLAVEEQFRQRQLEAARRELEGLKAEDFKKDDYQFGLYLLLKAEAAYHAGDYGVAIQHGQQSARILAEFPLNRRYGRVLLILSRTYSHIGDLGTAEVKAYDALASYRRAADTIGQIDAMNELARIGFISSDFDAACRFLDQARELSVGNPRKSAQLTGNAGRIRIMMGDWAAAEENLKSALSFNQESGEEVPQALNQLSLGYLHMRRREFVFAERHLSLAHEIIERLGLKREKAVYFEYAGELALAKGDTYKAKALLQEGFELGRVLAPESALVTQTGRRLAEVELALENLDDAMTLGQKTLELASQIGEREEVAAAHRLIARVFAARGEYTDAIDHGRQAVDLCRVINDPLETALTLLTLADIKIAANSEEADKIKSLLDDAGRTFKKLHLDYWLAETEYRAGTFACQLGDLSRGFKKLNRAEKLFASLGESVRLRRVHQFLASLADQAVALSISEGNEFKVFGKLINSEEIENLQTGHMDQIFRILLERTSASRAIIISPETSGAEPLMASFPLRQHQVRRFVEGFGRLLGEEIANDRPTLLLDARRDPYINDLFPDIPDVVASVVVVPFVMSDKSVSYIYLDRLSVDFSLNPFTQDDLNFAVGFSDIIAFKFAEIQRLKLMEDNRRLHAQLMEKAAFPNIITKNKSVLELLAQVRQVVDSNISIGIEGATGCGKDLLARAIHYNSNRRNKRFISVNCAALPETLLESELFGYRKGAYTGADRDKPGLFEEADGGTFFLDEIADMPLSIQAKILRVLEEKELVRLGETMPRKVDVRIISATNKDLKKEMETQRFRQDLYYRLSALTFKLPSLSDRRDDIPLLVGHFLTGTGKQMSPRTLSCLVAYDWPGNIRELENEVKKLVLLAGERTEIGPELLSAKILPSSVPGNGKAVAAVIETGNDAVDFSDSYSLYDYLAAHEKRFIIKALRERKGVKKHAAAMLKIPESTLRLKIKEYNIDLNRLDTIN